MATDSPDTPSTFRGTDRFEIVRRLGMGGMGVVYHAVNRERDMEVALKRLLRVDAADQARLLRVAPRRAGKLEREQVPWASVMAAVIRGGVAATRGNTAAAIAAYQRALEHNETAELGIFGAAVRRRLGELIGGDEGRALIEESSRWLVDNGLRNPVRSAFAFVPAPCVSAPEAADP